MSHSRPLLDTSGLSALARLGLLESTAEQVGAMFVTPEVLAEATEGDRPGAAFVREAVAAEVITVLEPIPVAVLPGLGLGETATIQRAIEGGMTAVIDDLDARRVALRLEVKLTGTVAILVRLDGSGSGPPISVALQDLDRIGFRVSGAVRAWALAAAERLTAGE